PAYGYLIALDPDGKGQLCSPSTVTSPPSLSDTIRFDDGTDYVLTGKPGLQAFVVVASRQPLPPYQMWAGDSRLRQLWKPGGARAGWRYDGHRFDPISNTSRGELRKRPGPPAAFQEICEYLATVPDIEAVQAIAFPVRPKG